MSREVKTMPYQKEIIKVSEISNDFNFTSDSSDVEYIRSIFKKAKDYSSFFVSQKDLDHGEITFVYGLTGIVPFVWVNAYLITE